MKVTECLYIMNLNRENKGNKLTISFMEKIVDYINYYESIQTLKSVILRSFDQTTFSLGTDYSSMEHAIRNKNRPELVRQLDKLQEFAENMAAANLAMPTNINGLICNSAASIFTQLPFVFCAGNTKVKFNEIDYQSPLLGGVSHTLARLGQNYGTFLALTSNQIGGIHIKELGFAKEYAILDYENVEHIKRFSPRLFDVENFEGKFVPFFGTQLNKVVDVDESVQEYFDRSKTENSKNVLFDLYYRKKIIEHANIQIKRDFNHPEQYLPEARAKIAGTQNYLMKYEADILSTIPETGVPDKIYFTPEEEGVITYAFGQNTIEGIFQRLEKLNTPFSQKIHAQLKSKNPYILEIILRQIRAAESMSFGEALKMEFATAMALAENDFSSKWLFKKYQGEFDEISEKPDFSELTKFGEEMFQNGEDVEGMSFSKVPQAFLPVKNYYRKFPEAFRCYFNSQALRRPELHKNYKDVVKMALLLYGVDYFSPAFDKLTALQNLRNYFRWEEKNAAKATRMSDLMSSSLSRDHYFRDRLQAIKNLKNDSNFAKRIEKIIDQAFRDELASHEQFLLERFKSVQRFDSLPDFEKLKKVIVYRMTDKMILTEEEKQQEIEMLLNLPLEIGFDRFTLSPPGEKLSHLAELKEAYSRKRTIETRDQLKKFYMNLLPANYDLLDVVKTKDVDVIWDKNRIFHNVHANEHHERKGHQGRLFKFINRGLDTPLEEHFRKYFLQMVIQLLESENQPISDETKAEILALIRRDIMLDYKWVAFDIYKIRHLQNTEFIHFMRQLRPDYAKVDLERYKIERKYVPPESQDKTKAEQVDSDWKQFNLESVKNVNSINFKNAELKKFEASPSSDSLFDLLYNNDVLSEGKKQKIKAIFDKKEHIFVQNMLSEFVELYESKFYDLYKNKILHMNETSNNSKIGKAFAATFQNEARNEFVAFILPHLFFNLSMNTMSKLESIFNTVTNFVANLAKNRSDIRKNLSKIGKMVNDGGFIADSENNLMASIELMDSILNLMIELNSEYRNKINMREDLLRAIATEIRMAIRMKIAILTTHLTEVQDFETDFLSQPGVLVKSLEDQELVPPEKRAEIESTLRDVFGERSQEQIDDIPIQVLRHLLLHNLEDTDPKFEEKEEEEEGENDPELLEYESRVRQKTKYFERLKVNDRNILGKLRDYTEMLREFLRVNKSENYYKFPTDEENAESEQTENPLTLLESIISGKEYFDVNIKGFIDVNFPKNSALKTEFEKIQQASHISYFSELTYKIGNLANAVEYGIFAGATHNNQIQQEILRPAIIKQRLSDGGNFQSDANTLLVDRVMGTGNFPYVQKLETLSRGYFQGQKSGCYDTIYYHLNKENTETPAHFSELDQRQTADEWIDLEIYKFCVAAFSAERDSRKAANSNLQSSQIGKFFDAKLLKEHFLRKLYTEMYTLERFSNIAYDDIVGFEAKIAAAARSDPKLLDWKKCLENDVPAKKHLAYEAFAFQGSDTSKSRLYRSFEYYQYLSDQIYDFHGDKKKLQPKTTVEETQNLEESFPTERLYEEVVNSLAASDEPKSESLKADLAKSLQTVARRLKLYK